MKSQNKKAWLNGHAGEEFADNCVDRLILKPWLEILSAADS